MFTPYTLFSSFAALFGWGGWAYYINDKADPTMGLMSGLTQGLSSFFITLVTVIIVTKIYNKLDSKISKLMLPAIAVVSFLTITLVLVHMKVGTPMILLTIAPSLTITFLFCVATAYKLSMNED